MDDLAAALGRLAGAFPGDLGPVSDRFKIKDEFDLVVWYGQWRVASEETFVDRILMWTPRILRLYLGGQMPGYDWWVTARFVEAGWREWPAHQRAAVEDVLRTWWMATLTEYPSAHPVGEVLAFVSQMTGEVESWLASWSAIGGRPAARQLCDVMTAVLSWSPFVYDFDEESAEDEIGRWLMRDGIDILSALPPSAELDAGLAELARWEDRRWWLRWP